MVFVLPSVLGAFLVAPLVLYGISVKVFQEYLGYANCYLTMSISSIIQALVLGILIPLISSIIPVLNALTRNLTEALDWTRSKTLSVYVNILQKNKKDITVFLLFGSIACVYGFTIYYYLPLGLLSFNLNALMRVFVFILLGMMLGLVLLAMNVQRVIEVAFTHCFLVFESTQLRTMVLNNLTAHKFRNRLTSIIYSISLGFIIFIMVSVNLQLDAFISETIKKKGGYNNVENLSSYPAL